jgi:hypothetical protein
LVPLRNLGSHVWCIHIPTARRMHVSRYVTVIASKWYSHTSSVLSLAFQKPYLKSNHFKRILFKPKNVCVSKSSMKYPILFNKEISKSKVLPKQIFVWSKNDFQKFVESSAPIKTLGPFQIFWNSASILKYLAKRVFQIICACPSKV